MPTLLRPSASTMPASSMARCCTGFWKCIPIWWFAARSCGIPITSFPLNSPCSASGMMKMSPYQAVEARVLGQLMTTQTVLDAIPSTSGLRSFLPQSIAKVPGVRSVSHSLLSDAQALWGRDLLGRDLLDQEARAELVRLQVKTPAHSFGELWLSLHDSQLFRPYQPYLANLINMAAVMLENRRLAAVREENNRF